MFFGRVSFGCDLSGYYEDSSSAYVQYNVTSMSGPAGCLIECQSGVVSVGIEHDPSNSNALRVLPLSITVNN